LLSLLLFSHPLNESLCRYSSPRILAQAEGSVRLYFPRILIMARWVFPELSRNI
jgi:hypothetical protein